MPQRDLVDEVLDTLSKAEAEQDHILILGALKKAKDDFLGSPYNKDPATYIQNRALNAASGGIIAAGTIQQGDTAYHCLMFNLGKRKERADVEELVKKIEAPVFKYEGNVYVLDQNKLTLGIAITQESAPVTRKLSR